MNKSQKLSLCIPTKNRWDFLKINLPKYLDNPFIDEIVFCDETGEDAKMIQETYKDNEKIKVYINDKILGPFFNKNKVVSLAKNEFICLMDSDNFAPLSYFESWDKYIKENGLKENVIYCPSRTIPQSNHGGFDYRSFIGSYNFEDCKRHYHNVTFSTMLNTGNYIFNKKLFIESGSEFTNENLDKTYKVCDVIYKNYLLLTKFNTILTLVPNMEYNHIVHNGSYYIETCSQIEQSKLDNMFK